jgi:tetratricopeptide (TPR) repeat protein
MAAVTIRGGDGQYTSFDWREPRDEKNDWRESAGSAVLSIGLMLLLAALSTRAATYTPDDYKKAANECMRVRNLLCAQTNWEYYLRFRPTDGNAFANLAIVMNQRDNHAGALAAFERAIDLGEGAYDLFAYYADSLDEGRPCR